MSWSHLVPSRRAEASPSTAAVAASLLACDFSRLAEEIRAVEKAGVDMLHLDVMDGHFVRNITFGPPLVKAVDRVAAVPLDTHLMIERPDRYLDAFLDAGADVLTVHIEASADPRRDLKSVRARGRKAGLAINPGTRFAQAEPYLEEVDLLLVMSVVPGFGGQSFIETVLSEVEQAAQARSRRGLTFAIEIDGGVGPESAARARSAGVDVLVAGTSIFGGGDYAAAVRDLRGR